MGTRAKRLAAGVTVFWLCVLFLDRVDVLGGEALPATKMPAR